MKKHTPYLLAGTLAGIFLIQAVPTESPTSLPSMGKDSIPAPDFRIEEVEKPVAAHVQAECQRYSNVLDLIDNMHFSGAVSISQQEIAEGAYQGMLDYAFYELKLESKSDEDMPTLAFDEPEDSSQITSFRLGTEIYSFKPSPEALTSYADHCTYLAQLAVPLSENTGLKLLALFDNAIQGAIDVSRDPHTSYMDADGYAAMQQKTSGEFGGVGIEVRLTDGVVEIIFTHENTPGALAGLLPGDRIVQIDGEDVMGMTLNEAVDKMRGEVGTSVSLSVQRNDAPVSIIPVRRGVIVIPAVTSSVVGQHKDSVHARVSTFNEHTAEQLTAQLDRLLEQAKPGPDGRKRIVIDLRNDPGGLLSQAELISDLMVIGDNERAEERIERIREEQAKLDITKERERMRYHELQAQIEDLSERLWNGTIASSPLVATGKTASDEVVYTGRKSAKNYFDYDVVAIIDQYSASASEIVAGAMQDSGIRIVGTRSYGKGSVQSIIPLNSDGTRSGSRYNAAGGLRVTTSAFFPGKTGLSNQGVGIIPNIVVHYGDARDERAETTRREGDLENALVISAERTRAGMKPVEICSLKSEFAGALTTSQRETIEPEFQKSYSLADESGKSHEDIMLDADLACALGDERYVTFGPYDLSVLSP